jgi:hypothetical protein
MTRFTSDAILPGISLKYARRDLAFAEIFVLFSWRKCVCGRTAKVTTLANIQGSLKAEPRITREAHFLSAERGNLSCPPIMARELPSTLKTASV